MFFIVLILSSFFFTCSNINASEVDNQSTNESDKIKRLVLLKKLQMSKSIQFNAHEIKNEFSNEFSDQTSDHQTSKVSENTFQITQTMLQSSDSCHFSNDTNTIQNSPSNNSLSLREIAIRNMREQKIQARKAAIEKIKAQEVIRNNDLFKQKNHYFAFEAQENAKKLVNQIKEESNKATKQQSYETICKVEERVHDLENEIKYLQNKAVDIEKAIIELPMSEYNQALLIAQLTQLNVQTSDRELDLWVAKETLDCYRWKLEQVKNYEISAILKETENLSIENLEIKSNNLDKLRAKNSSQINKYHNQYKKINEEIAQSKDLLRSWTWWLNPFSKSEKKLNEEISLLEKEKIKSYVKFNNAKHNKEVLLIAANKIKKIILKKNLALDWAANQKEAAQIEDNKQLHQAINKTLSSKACLYNQEYNITDTTREVLSKHGINTENVTSYSGNAIQHYLHNKLISNLNKYTDLAVDNIEAQECLDSAVSLNLLGQDLNNDCKIDEAIAVNSAADHIFEYVKAYVDLNLAVQEGILEGTIQTINDVKRIAELASKTVYGLATDPEKTIEKIGTKLQEVKKTCIETVLAISQIATDPEIRSKVLTEIYDTPTRDKVKAVAKIATETYLQTNILKAAIIGGNKTIALAKSAQRRSKDILVAAQGFLECPHSVIIEEVSALLSETATTEPKVLKAVLGNACKDAALVSELSNAEVSIGEGISALANDTELAANIRIKHNCKAQGWNLSENGSFINGRYYSKHALERIAPINAEVRAVLEKRALKKYPLRYPLEAHKEYNENAYGEYVKYINSRNISPSVVENAISTGVKKIKPNNTIEYLTSDVKVVTNIFGDIVTVYRIS